MSLFQAKIEGVPQFVSYFAPVHRAMLHFGGQAAPQQVFAYLAEYEGLTAEDMEQVNSNGRPTFENRAAWARYFMTKAGWMYSPKRSVWALTDLGKQASDLTESQAVALFKSAHAQIKGDEDEIEAPDDKVQPDNAQYWFAGAMWGGSDDQMPRFLQEGIWQNGYEDKFAEQVLSMKPGDRIAIKSSYVRKHKLPFNNRGQRVSGMKIKVIGTVTRNHEDGRTVDVAWEPLETPQEWFFYTYRATLTRARVEDEVLARRLVAFTFDGAKQDYDFFMAQPYWRDRFLDPAPNVSDMDDLADDSEQLDEVEQVSPAALYGVQDILAEGCFVPEGELHTMLRHLSSKKKPDSAGAAWYR